MLKLYKFQKDIIASMQNLQKLQSLRKSGRFQCDLFFYTQLCQILTTLNLYEYLPSIKKNKSIIQKTTQLTKQHLICLQQEDDEEKALQIIKQINKEVLELNTKCIQEIFNIIQKMNGKSYEDKVIAHVKGYQCKKLYAEIFDRINNNVHDPALKLVDMLLVAIFVKENGEKIGQFIQVFGSVIENGIQQLRSFKTNQQFIQNNPQIQEIPKVKAFSKGSHIIITTLLKFNEIYKLLSHINKYSIKLGAIKKQIQKTLEIESGHSKQQSHHHSYHEESTKLFKKFLLEGGDVPKFCSYCLGVGSDHSECKNVIKLFFRKKE